MRCSSGGRLSLAAFTLFLITSGCDGAAPRNAAGAPDASAPGSEGTGPDPLDDSSEVVPTRDARLEDLLSGRPELARAALAAIRDGGDPRYTGPLIELLRALDIGIVDGFHPGELVDTLEAVSGESFGRTWSDWVRWYARTELEPPTGFTGWKGRLLGRVDPNFARLLAYGMPSRIRVEEIVWGGVAFEGIPALDDPEHVAASEADELAEGDAVFGIAIGGESRAYPLRILDWHEMANDSVGGTPISLAYCTLCGSGIAYDRRAANGETYDFGSSGLLMRSNKLMVDRQTRSLWNQFTGEPVLGPLAAEPRFQLRVVPSVATTWGDWKRRHPETSVVSFETGFPRPYEAGAAYGDYFASDETMFPVSHDDASLRPKERVVGIVRGSSARSYPLATVLATRVVNDTVGDYGVVLIAASGDIEIKGRSRRSGLARSYSAGGEVRAYERGEQSFRAATSVDRVVDGSGGVWRVTEVALVGPAGERLARLPSILSYHFGWSAFHPDSTTWQVPR